MYEELIQKISSVKSHVIGMRFVAQSKNTCSQCHLFSDLLFELPYAEDDMPLLPLHPNCCCYYEPVDDEKYWEELKRRLVEKQAEEGEPTISVTFGTKMDAVTFHEVLTTKQRIDWCLEFKRQFNATINRYSEECQVPKRLLAIIIANEMIDWDSVDGTFADGLGGGGVGYAQISLDTAIKFKVTGLEDPFQRYHDDGLVWLGVSLKDYYQQYRNNLHTKLRTTDGSVQIAARLLKIYLDSFYEKAKSGNLGEGYAKSLLYARSNHAILSGKGNIVELYPPEWLTWTMVAIWNSGLEILDAKDLIGEDNYRNAFRHGGNAAFLRDYLPVLVK